MAKAAKAKPEGQAKKVNVHLLTRIEGHGNIIAEIDESGAVTACRWEVPEAPRFFEAMLVGRHYKDVHHIACRICGICSIGHQMSSLQATEDALGIRLSEQNVILRKLALHAENLQSHLLHIGYLVLPDLLGVPSVLPLATTHKEELLTVIGARRIANEFSDTICGRTIHPQRFTPGGMVKYPSESELRELAKKLGEGLNRLKIITDLMAALRERLPDFQRPTEYVALTSPTEYPLLWGSVGSSQVPRRPARLYRDVTREFCVPQSTAKWAKGASGPYMVGALSRFNLNHAKLLPAAKLAAAKLGLVAPCHNPYFITVAQLVECIHSVEDSLNMLDKLLSKGLKIEAPAEVKPCAGRGYGAVEVPRGLLFHAYEYDAQGRIAHADCVIPTNQNHANIQKDMEDLVPTLAGLTEPEIELRLSMLVRAYDPCVSCSTHCIDLTGERKEPLVKFVRKGK